MTGHELIMRERERQQAVEGYGIDHDLSHGPQVLARAATSYVNAHPTMPAGPPLMWPWAEPFWKPKDPLSNLVRAGALYQAAIDITPPEHGTSRTNMETARDRCAHAIDALLRAVVEYVTPPEKVPHEPADGPIPMVRSFQLGQGVAGSTAGTMKIVGADLILTDDSRLAFALSTDHVPLFVEGLISQWEKATS